MAYLTTGDDPGLEQAASSSLKTMDWIATPGRIIITADRVIDRGVNAPNSVHEIPSIAIDQKNDIVYVTNYLQRSVSVVDGSANKIIGRIEMDGNPTGVAVDQDTGRLYVSEQQAILVFDGKVARP